MIELSSRTLFLTCLLGAAVGLASSCSLLLDFELPESECWCGEQWRTQISGAQAYDAFGQLWEVPATDTTHVACVSMLQHLALDTASEQDPVYVALRDSFTAAAIAKCEAAGEAHWMQAFASSDCATVGEGAVQANLVHTGSCWEAENHEAGEFCPLSDQCGDFYDCGDHDPITNWGDTGGEDDEVPWSCVEIADDETPSR